MSSCTKSSFQQEARLQTFSASQEITTKLFLLLPFKYVAPHTLTDEWSELRSERNTPSTSIWRHFHSTPIQRNSPLAPQACIEHSQGFLGTYIRNGRNNFNRRPHFRSSPISTDNVTFRQTESSSVVICYGKLPRSFHNEVRSGDEGFQR